jgi:hypothetical protein
MFSTTWARRILSFATLYSVIGMVLCRCVTRPVAVANKLPTVLMQGCNRPVALSC